MGIFVKNILFLIYATHYNHDIYTVILAKKRNEIWQKLFKQKYCNVGMTWSLVKKGEKQEADNT